MATYEKSIFINRPRQEVWDFYTNPANLPQFSSSTVSAEWTSQGPPAVGSILRHVDKMLGRTTESTSKITVWDPPNEVGRKSVGGLAGELTIKLEPRENGTQLNVRATAEFRGLFKIAETLFGKQVEKHIDANYEALKLLLEAGQAKRRAG